MASLGDLFSHLLSDKSNYLCSKKGSDFEDRINSRLRKIFTRIKREDFSQEQYNEVKKNILYKESGDKVKNNTEFDSHYISQPYGSQEYPDFLIFDGLSVVPIEVKFSEHKKTNPFWNSGLPRLNGVYIFGAFGLGDITFFKGSSLLSLVEIRQLQDFFDKGLKDYQDAFNGNEMKNQKYGFNAYIRKAFQQNKKHNTSAVVDFFNNREREELEREVIEYVS